MSPFVSFSPQTNTLEAEEEWKATCDSVARFIGETLTCPISSWESNLSSA